jgi:tetratricopeptide (TPR) repeat protein
VQSGADPEAIKDIRKALADCEKIGANLDRPYFLALLAEALMQFDLTEEAEAVLTESLEQIRASRSFFYKSELLRLRGCVVATRGDKQEATDLYRRAVEVASEQGARSLELRALISLVELSPEEEQGRATLGESLDSFSEGLDSPDLRIAAALCRRAAGGRSPC